MSASEIRLLADRAGITAATSLLDVCCGIGGPGRMLAAERGCAYLGVDYSASALDIARGLANGSSRRFVQGHVPPLPDGRFDVVLLLETMLAFPDKRELLGAVAELLPSQGRFAFTIEVGRPLSCAERAAIPDADTVHLVEFAELETLLIDAGLSVSWHDDHTASHQSIATALLESFCRHASDIARVIGTAAFAELITAHQLWSDWMRCSRVRKIALVAVKDGPSRADSVR